MFADALQIVVFPFFGEGALSPINDLLDIALAWALTRLLGWHWAFIRGSMKNSMLCTGA